MLKSPLPHIKKKVRKFFKKLGPGLITGASDDDPSGIATYSQAGAGFGTIFLWSALLTYPLMYALQEMCARIGIVSGTGLAEVIRLHYPKFVSYAQIILVVPAIILNIAADIAGMSAVSHLLFPQVSTLIFSFIITGTTIIFLIFFSYNKIASILKYFCLSLLTYFIVPFLVKQDWPHVLSTTFIPSFQWNKEYISILVAILGTTISPYLFFWQASMSYEHREHNNNGSLHKEIKDMKTDVNVGMFLSNLAMYFIILTTGSVLYTHGITEINTVEQAAQALEPLAGEWAFVLFSLGVLGVGFLSIPVLGACIGYILTGTLGLKKGLDYKFKEAKEFYYVIISTLLISLVLNIIGLDPIKALILTAIIYGVITPFLILLILHICNSKKIMGNQTNSLALNILGVICLLIMSSAATALLITTF